MGSSFFQSLLSPHHDRNRKPHHRASNLSIHSRKLTLEPLEDRRMLSVSPLNIALISDAVAQAEQIQQAATEDTIAIIYDADTMTTSGLVDLVESVSAAHNGALIGHLGIVTHGASGEISLGTAEVLNLDTMQSHTADLEQLGSLLTDDARLDLYSCSVAADDSGKTFVDELSTVIGATIYASDDPVGTVAGADLVWEYHTSQMIANNDIFSVKKIAAIPELCFQSMNAMYYDSPNNAYASDANVGQCTWYVYGRIQETGLIGVRIGRVCVVEIADNLGTDRRHEQA